MELRLRPHWELILFNIINIRDINVILGFLWLETTEPLIFWAQQTVVFPEAPDQKIFLYTILKGKLLYFNIISSEELIIYFQKKNHRLKYSGIKIASKCLCYPEKRKWYPSSIHSLKNYLNKNLRSRVSQNINYKIMRLSSYLGRYLVKS